MPSRLKKPRPDKIPKCHVHVGDKIIVRSGDAKGKTGTVIKVWPMKQRALIEGEASLYDTRHVRANPQANVEGGRIRRLKPIHLAKLALVDPTTSKPTRVRRERTDAGVVRVAVKSKHRFENSARP